MYDFKFVTLSQIRLASAAEKLTLATSSCRTSNVYQYSVIVVFAVRTGVVPNSDHPPKTDCCPWEGAQPDKLYRPV